jgi:hypothetical protein
MPGVQDDRAHVRRLLRHIAAPRAGRFAPAAREKAFLLRARPAPCGPGPE